ncbi:MAG: putative DNA-binding domain-containing protein [Gammaproteobacteria bacterium]|jgi:hypothetical protein
MTEREQLRQAQLDFAAHIRDPERVPAPPGIEDRRMKIYRDLFYGNLRDLLGRSFPVVRQVLGDEGWDRTVRDWLVRHRAQTPLFLELPQEFLTYLKNQSQLTEQKPFLYELAHYEWVELALSIDERDIDDGGIDRDGDLLAGHPVLSPLAWSLAYAWPVHRISPAYQPTEAPAEPTRLVVYRNRADEIGFLEINPVTARLLELLDRAIGATSGRDCLRQIAAELEHPDPEAVVNGGAGILEELRARHVLLGVQEESMTLPTDGAAR